MQQVRDLGLDKRCWILAGVGPVKSLRALEHMRREVPGMYVPDDGGARDCAAYRRNGSPDEGLALCAEIIQQVKEIPGRGGRARHGVRLGGGYS